MGRMSENRKYMVLAVLIAGVFLLPGACWAEEAQPQAPLGETAAEQIQDTEEPVVEASEEIVPEEAEEEIPVEEEIPSVLAGVKLTRVQRTGKDLFLQWEEVPFAEEYQVQYARSALWRGARTINVKAGAGGIHLQVQEPATWCVRVRAVCRTEKGPVYSGHWTTSWMQRSAKGRVSFLKKGGKLLDIRKEAGKKLLNHDIGEGSCSDGKYLYMCFEYRCRDKQGNKTVEIRIAKIRLADKKLLKVSKSLRIGHANSIVYNKRIRKLIATGDKKKDPNLRIIDPGSLKVLRTVHVNTARFRDTPEGFNALGYDSKNDLYYIRARDFNGYMYVLNNRFVATKRFVLNHNPATYIQGIEMEGDYILLSQSRYQTSTKNTVTLFDREGHRLQDIQLGLTGELESVFHVGNKLYGTVHVKSELSKKDRKKIKKIQKANKKRKKTKRKSVQPIYSKYRKTYVFQVTLP